LSHKKKEENGDPNEAGEDIEGNFRGKGSAGDIVEKEEHSGAESCGGGDEEEVIRSDQSPGGVGHDQAYPAHYPAH